MDLGGKNFVDWKMQMPEDEGNSRSPPERHMEMSNWQKVCRLVGDSVPDWFK